MIPPVVMYGVPPEVTHPRIGLEDLQRMRELFQPPQPNGDLHARIDKLQTTLDQMVELFAKLNETLLLLHKPKAKAKKRRTKRHMRRRFVQNTGET